MHTNTYVRPYAPFCTCRGRAERGTSIFARTAHMHTNTHIRPYAFFSRAGGAERGKSSRGCDEKSSESGWVTFGNNRCARVQIIQCVFRGDFAAGWPADHSLHCRRQFCCWVKDLQQQVRVQIIQCVFFWVACRPFIAF
jgi:hypothetical protein